MQYCYRWYWLLFLGLLPLLVNGQVALEAVLTGDAAPQGPGAVAHALPGVRGMLLYSFGTFRRDERALIHPVDNYLVVRRIGLPGEAVTVFRLHLAEYGPLLQPTLSPDGVWVAAKVGDGSSSFSHFNIVLLNLDTHALFTVGKDQAQVANWSPLSWSPNSRYLRYYRGGTVLAGSVPDPEKAYLFDRVTRAVRHIRGPMVGFTWTPASKLLYTVTERPQPGVYLADPAGGAPVRLIAGACCPAASPDGRWIAAVAGNRLVVIPHTGGRQVALPFRAPARITSLTWSPDGSRIAVAMGRRTVLVPRAGGPVVTLPALAPADEYRYWWSVAGDRLFRASWKTDEEYHKHLTLHEYRLATRQERTLLVNDAGNYLVESLGTNLLGPSGNGRYFFYQQHTLAADQPDRDRHIVDAALRAIDLTTGQSADLFTVQNWYYPVWHDASRP